MEKKSVGAMSKSFLCYLQPTMYGEALIYKQSLIYSESPQGRLGESG